MVDDVPVWDGAGMGGGSCLIPFVLGDVVVEKRDSIRFIVSKP